MQQVIDYIKSFFGTDVASVIAPMYAAMSKLEDIQVKKTDEYWAHMAKANDAEDEADAASEFADKLSRLLS